MRIHLLGVRGSSPTPGAEFARHGGNTSCVAVAGDDGRVRLLIDGGTGLRRLPALVPGGFVGTLLLGHLHWDHTHGLPFCPTLDHPEAQVHVRAPSIDGRPVNELLSQAMSPPNFPIDPSQLRGEWSWEALEDGVRFRAGDFDVLGRQIPHKGGPTFGFRVDDGNASFAYLSDHMPQALGDGPDGWGEYHDAACALADDVDVLIHDAQYTSEELPTRGYFGHAAAEYAVALGEKAGARKVVLFHHDPARTDDEVDAIVARFASAAVPVEAAVEGTILQP